MPSRTGLVCICVLMMGILGQAVEDPEGNSTVTPQKPIRQSESLNAGEQEYVLKRKRIVLESLNRLGINCTLESVPHIALLGSGGGQRAAVSLLGSLYQMKEDDLLDSLLYLGGVSGSTWSMSSLYADPAWSKANISRVIDTMSGPSPGLGESIAWLEEMKETDKDFSLTDIWAVLTAAGVMKELDRHHLSEEADRDSTNPYPIYNAIEKFCNQDGKTESKWFEVTPHEAGFTELGLFINTSLLGSVFQRGELKEERPEMDMVKLQGVLGSALADENSIIESLPPLLQQLSRMYKLYIQAYQFVNTIQHLTALLKSGEQDATVLAAYDHFEKQLQEETSRNLASQHYATLEDTQYFETQTESLRNSSLKENATWIVENIFPLIKKWEWGTTKSFLYQYQDSAVPSCLQSEDIHIVDAGLLINVPYPPFLGDKRDIDLMIAPEYSAGNMFETLTLARDYAAKLKKPFPEIDENVLKEKDWPKDCYVFEGEQNQPTIVFMPLFNQKNCKDAEEVSQMMTQYSTFQPPFGQEKIDFLFQTAKTNMENNKDVIVREIQKAVQRRHNKRVVSSAKSPLFSFLQWLHQIVLPSNVNTSRGHNK